MAIIILNPGESFEHFHLHESITKQVEGSIELSFNGQTSILKNGESVTVPANTSHITKNIGGSIAKFECAAHVVISEPLPPDPMPVGA